MCVKHQNRSAPLLSERGSNKRAEKITLQEVS